MSMANIINNISNSTFNHTIGVDEITINVLADDGYTISMGVVKYIEELYEEEEEVNLTISSDGKSASSVIEYVSLEHPIYLEGLTQDESLPTINIDNQVVGTKDYYNYDGNIAIIKIVSDFKSGGGLVDVAVTYTNSKGDSSKQYMVIKEISNGVFEGTATISDIDPSDGVVITGKFVKALKVNSTLANCHYAGYVPYYVEHNSELNVSIISNHNTEFDNEKPPTIQYINDEVDEVTENFIISSDKKSCSCKVTVSDYGEVNIIADAYPVTVIGGNYGSINVYGVTIDNLDEFAKKRFFEKYEENVQVDLGVYVNRLKRIHTTIPFISDDVLRCGNHNTEIVVKQPSVDEVTLDFGSIEIPYFNGNSLDYESSVKMFLPFRGYVDLPSSYVGKAIRLEYVINVITGGGIAKVICDEIPFMIEPIEPSTDVIYKTSNQRGEVIGRESFSDMLLYGLEPYIYCEWYKSDITNGINGDVQRGVIGDFRGFISFRYVDTISSQNMLTSEQTLIYDALERGVYIK